MINKEEKIYRLKKEIQCLTLKLEHSTELGYLDLCEKLDDLELQVQELEDGV